MDPKNNITHIQMGRRGFEWENLPHNWENLDVNTFKVPQDRAIYMFCGNNANRAEAGNGDAKIIRSLLPAQKKGSETQIYTFYYSGEPFKSGGFLLPDYEREANLLFDKIFKPILFDDKGNMKEKKGIETALSKIVLSAHCGGSNFANIVVDRLYECLLQKFSRPTAELLINKIQYFAYAPNEIPNHNVSAFIITPSVDPNNSWAKALSVAESQKVDVDYPRGTIRKLIKAKQNLYADQAFKSTFEDTRAIMFAVGNSTYYIPGQMNPSGYVGDHSTECLVRDHILNSGTRFAETARLTNETAKLYLSSFLTNGMTDLKGLFSKVALRLSKTPPTSSSTM